MTLLIETSPNRPYLFMSANTKMGKSIPPDYTGSAKVAPLSAPVKSKRQRSTVIVKVADEILLTETHGGTILLPGGAIGRRELPIAAAARELMEETGLIATTITFLFEHESASTFHHVFLAIASGVAVARDDAARILYCGPKTDDTQLNMSPATRDILGKFFEI